MSDEELDEAGDEVLVEDLEDLEVDDLDLEDVDVDLDAEIEEVVGEVIGEVIAPAAGALAADEEEDEDEDVLDLDEELHPDDVEAPLDALLQERTASATLEDEEEEVEDDETDTDERGEGPTRIVPRRPGEFLCSSCFLVLPRHQLADEERMLCRDCA